MRYCANCQQDMQPKKEFGKGKFIGLFILGIVLLAFFGGIGVMMTSPFVMAGAGASYAETQFVASTVIGFGWLLFFLPWGLYIVHHVVSKAPVCPMCKARNFDVGSKDYGAMDAMDGSHKDDRPVSEKGYDRWFLFKASLILVGCLVVGSILTPFPYPFVLLAVGLIVVFIYDKKVRKSV